MAVFRVHKTDNYTVMSNTHLRDTSLSLKAKGLLSMVLSLPDDWKYSIKGLASLCLEGQDAVKAAIAELEQGGYVIRTKRFPGETTSGRIEYEYDFFEDPKQGAEKQGVEKQGVEKQHLEIQPLELQGVELQGLENRQLLNKEGTSTEQPSKEEPSTENKDSVGQAAVVDIIAYLNSVAGTSFRPSSKATQRLITARLREGYTVEDFKRVIDNKAAQWKNDPKWSGFLRPSTLFAPSHFDEYLNQSSSRRGRGVDLSIYD